MYFVMVLLGPLIYIFKSNVLCSVSFVSVLGSA